MTAAAAERRARFDAIYRQFREPILAFLLRRTAQPADAADALGEVFVVAWRRIDEVPDGDAARMWLFGVARNVLANQRRSIRRQGLLAEALADALSRASRPAPSREGEHVDYALSTLSPDDRMIVTLSAWEQLTPAEIGEVLGLAAGTVRVRLHRARERLRRAHDLARAADPAVVASSELWSSA